MRMTTAKLPEAPIPDTHVGILETALLGHGQHDQQ
jgi:hypothetical protein